MSKNFYPVEYDLKTIPKERVDNHIFVKGSKWAEPRKNSFVQQCDMVLKNRKKASNKLVKDNFSFENISNQYNEVLGEYLYV